VRFELIVDYLYIRGANEPNLSLYGALKMEGGLPEASFSVEESIEIKLA
jgi:hypothetical protein